MGPRSCTGLPQSTPILKFCLLFLFPKMSVGQRARLICSPDYGKVDNYNCLLYTYDFTFL